MVLIEHKTDGSREEVTYDQMRDARSGGEPHGSSPNDIDERVPAPTPPPARDRKAEDFEFKVMQDLYYRGRALPIWRNSPCDSTSFGCRNAFDRAHQLLDGQLQFRARALKHADNPREIEDFCDDQIRSFDPHGYYTRRDSDG